MAPCIAQTPEIILQGRNDEMWIATTVSEGVWVKKEREIGEYSYRRGSLLNYVEAASFRFTRAVIALT